MNYYGETIEAVHYTLDGDRILAETHYGTDGAYTRHITYSYDESGSPVGLSWDNSDFYYYKNIFGDVLGIMNSSGTMVVRYTYDAWGRNISRTGSMASTLGYYNPYRYRGYYYDRETGLYYLQARYYDPTIGRFISPDPVLDTTNAVGCNPYVYCGNDPINRIDPNGMFWKEIGDFFKGAWDVVSDLAGFELSIAITEGYSRTHTPYYWPIVIQEEQSTTYEIFSMGDSSKIFSVYTDINIDGGLDSSGGYKINVGKFTLDIGASSSDYYITGSWTDNDIENSYGIRVDKLRGQVGIEGAVTTYTGPAASKESIFLCANGLCLVYVVVYAIAAQYGRAPAHA